MAIQRRSLRSQVREELLARMRSGAVQPNEGINEVVLASELGISRTPLREALISLETEGQIESENGKGFRFGRLSAREFEELAPVMAALEGLALGLTPPEKLPAIAHELSRLAADFNQELAEHSLVARRDDEWHHLMLSGCTNQRLLRMIEGVRDTFHRYESLLIPSDFMVARVAAEHADIAYHLGDGNIPAAQAALESTWQNGVRRILANTSNTYMGA